MPQWSLATFPPGFNFRPHGRDLIAFFLSHKVLHGEVPNDGVIDGIAEDMDIFSSHPANLTFPPCNQAVHGQVWSYFFELGPIGEYRDTPEGFWCRYGTDKPYTDSDGQVIAFRSRFAFYDTDEKLTMWRMKEYRLNRGSRQFGTPIDPKMKDCVVCKVYNEVDIPEEPPVVWIDESDGEEEEGQVAAANMQQQQ